MAKKWMAVLALCLIVAWVALPAAGQAPVPTKEPATPYASPQQSVPDASRPWLSPVREPGQWRDALDDVNGMSDMFQTTGLGGEVILSQIVWRADLGGVRSMVRGTAPDNKIYIGSDSGQLRIYDPATGAVQDKGKPVPGEPDWGWNTLYLVNIGGKIYGGSSGIGHLFVYTPTTGTSQDLGQPFAGDGGISSLMTYGGKIYGGTGNGSGDGQFFVYNPTTRATEKQFTAVAGEVTVYSLALGPDNKVYGGTGNGNWDPNRPGHLFVFNPATPAVAPVDKGVTTPGGAVMTLAVGPGNLLFGGRWQGNLFSFSPATNAFDDCGQPPDAWGIFSIVKGNDNLLYLGTASRRSHLFAYNPTTRAFTDVGQANWNDWHLMALLPPVADGVIYGGTEWRGLFSYDPGAGKHPYRPTGTCTSVNIVPAVVEHFVPGCQSDSRALTRGTDGRIYIAHACNELWVYDPASGVAQNLGGNPQGDLYSLATGGDGKIYGGTQNTHLIVYDPATGSMTDLGQPVANEWAIYSLTRGLDGRIYGGTESWDGGPHGHLFVYDPSSGLSTDLGQAVADEREIRSLTTGLDGRIYGGTGPNGHLFVYDPATGAITDLGRPADESHVFSLATAPDGTVWGGTCCNAHLFRYNPANGLFADKGRILPDDDRIAALAVAPDGTVYGGSGEKTGTVFRYSPLTGSVARLGRVVAENSLIPAILLGESGVLYGVTRWPGSLFSYHPGMAFDWGTVTYAATVPASTTLTVDILDMDGNAVMTNVPSGAAVMLDPVKYSNLRLRGNLGTANGNVTPRLSEWKLTWTAAGTAPSALRFPTNTVLQCGGLCVCGPSAIDVAVENASNVAGFEFSFRFDPGIVRVESIELGSFFTSPRPFTALPARIDNSAGTAAFGAYSQGPLPAPSGSGVVARVYFTPVNIGNTALTFDSVSLRDPGGMSMAVIPEGGAIATEGYLIRDLDGDCVVDITDIMLVAGRWGLAVGDPGYDSHYDLDGDMNIDIVDIMLVVAHWGRKCSAPGGSPSPADSRESAAPDDSSAGPGKRLPLKITRRSEVYTVDVVGTSVSELGGFDLTLNFDPRKVQVEAVTLGDWMASTGRQTGALGPMIDNVAGTVRLGGFSYGREPGASGDGLLATITLRSVGIGSSKLILSTAQITDTRGGAGPAVVSLALADALP